MFWKEYGLRKKHEQHFPRQKRKTDFFFFLFTVSVSIFKMEFHNRNCASSSAQWKTDKLPAFLTATIYHFLGVYKYKSLIPGTQQGVGHYNTWMFSLQACCIYLLASVTNLHLRSSITLLFIYFHNHHVIAAISCYVLITCFYLWVYFIIYNHFVRLCPLQAEILSVLRRKAMLETVLKAIQGGFCVIYDQ